MSDAANCSVAVPLMINKLFLRLEDSFAQNQQSDFSQDDLIELYGIFGDVLHAALDLIDHNRIKLYTLASRRRQIVEIQAAHTSSYSFKFFPHTNYCPCNAFVEQVIRNADTYTCRHVLAAKLAMISRRNIEEIVADDVFNYLILTIGDPS